MIQKPKGTIDILPADSAKWQYIEETMRSVCGFYGYGEIRLPTFEATELFSRGVGDTTDVVQKEMYTFTPTQDKDKKSITLRPEGTANVMRSVIENSLYGDALPLKVYYIMTCFRYETPQSGRSREYYTFGIEQIGSTSPIVDAEVMGLADALIKKLGIKGVALHINSIGCMEPGCRQNYHRVFKEYLGSSYESLCETCKSRFGRNPVRVLDCKSDICKNIVADAPKSKDYLCGKCGAHFENTQSYLKALGIDFVIDPLIVRGLDYYTKTVFEFISGDIGALGTIAGGGRYDGLSELIGGPKLPGIGFGLGMGRLMAAFEGSGGQFPEKDKPKIFIASLPGDEARQTAATLVDSLREDGIYAETDNMDRSLKSQMKYADKTGAQYVYVIGEREIAEKKATLKNMRTSEQVDVGFGDLAQKLKEGI
jgi:histidyl-tRNA synthetase